jgi:ribosomal protein S18 acetylase RimI-like enzyme
MLEIRPLQIQDCPAVASAHAAFLRTPFHTWGGIHLLQAHYEILTFQQGGICFVALQDSQFAGFVCGIWDHRVINQLNRRKPLRLAIYSLQHLLARPNLLQENLRSFFLRRSGAIQYPEGYELRPIVVLPQFRGQGVADQLVRRLIQDAGERGYDQVFLFTEADNLPAIRFYTRFGFAPSETPDESARLFRYFIRENQHV